MKIRLKELKDYFWLVEMIGKDNCLLLELAWRMVCPKHFRKQRIDLESAENGQGRQKVWQCEKPWVIYGKERRGQLFWKTKYEEYSSWYESNGAIRIGNFLQTISIHQMMMSRHFYFCRMKERNLPKKIKGIRYS